ncbi:MAG: D-glycerate dehydrogenase [Alphaproteobacteria bacterium]
MTKPVIAVTRKLPAATESRMRELFDARLNADDQELSAERIVALCDGADALVPTVTDTIDSGLIAALPDSVRLMANFGVGVNHIDLAAADARNIAVTNTPGVLTDDTADQTMALLLATPRRLVEGDRLARSGKWEGWTPTFMVGHRVTGKRLGIIGMGRIGQAVARRARGFGIAIHYHNRHRVPAEIEAALEATFWEDLDQMLGQMDLVSINCPQTPETTHLFDARRLDLLQPHAVIVNTARGGIMDEAALAERLAAGRIAGAGLDVYEDEPAINEKLRGLDNVVLAPHLGSAPHAGRIAMGEKVVINLQSVADGHPPPDRVLVG